MSGLRKPEVTHGPVLGGSLGSASLRDLAKYWRESGFEEVAQYLMKTATSYTKDYDGPFPDGGPLARVNIEADGQEIVSIPRSLLETLLDDIRHDINPPDLSAERMRELLSDYVRDKKRIGELLGLPENQTLIHDMQEERLLEIRMALRSDAPAYEQLNRVQRAMGMFLPNVALSNGGEA